MKVSDIAVMSSLQKQIIRAAAAVGKKDGLLIYRTCSLEPEENDAQIDAFLGENLNFVLEPPPEGTVAPELMESGRLRVLPQRHGTDGAFAARLRRVS
jgi:16S rRNA (cytosine967-C5)-methyltransferase